MHDADVLVIGSGAGGLVAAVALARAGKRVHVVEQHSIPGGSCHSFTLDGFRFSPGVHCIGDLGPGKLLRRIFEGLDVAGDVTFFEQNPNAYDHLRVGGPGGLRFDFPAGREALARRIAERFPSQERGVRAYLDVVERMGGEVGALLASTERWRDMAMLPLRAPTSTRYGLFSAANVLARFVEDPLCRAVLSTQCAEHGLPLSRARFGIQAAVQAHFLDGAYYPKGGGGGLVKALTRGLKNAGGTLETSRKVERILVERDGGRLRAVGARFADGRELRARQVVSNADPAVTYRLVGEEHLPAHLRWQLRATRWSVAAMSLFLAVDADLRTEGLDSGTYWLRNTPDSEGFFLSRRDLEEGDGPLPIAVNVSTLKDPTHFDGRHHVLEVFAFVDYAPFERWEHTGPENRPPEYVRWKDRIEARMLAKLDTLVPGLSRRVVFKSLGTPLTNTHYVAATRGAIYGTEKNVFQMGPWAFGSRASIDGLLMCGASTFAAGVIGASLSGLRTAAHVLDCSWSDLIARPGRPLVVHPVEDPSRWPADLAAAVRRRASRGRANASPAEGE